MGYYAHIASRGGALWSALRNSRNCALQVIWRLVGDSEELVQYQRGHQGGGRLIAGRLTSANDTVATREAPELGRGSCALGGIGDAEGAPSAPRRRQNPRHDPHGLRQREKCTSSTRSSPRGGAASWVAVVAQRARRLRSRPTRFGPTSPSRTRCGVRLRLPLLLAAADDAALAELARGADAVDHVVVRCGHSPPLVFKGCSAPTTRWRRRLSWHRSSPPSTRRWRRGTSRRPPRSGKRASSYAAPTSRCSISRRRARRDRSPEHGGRDPAGPRVRASQRGDLVRRRRARPPRLHLARARRSTRALTTPIRRARSSRSAATTAGSRRRRPSPTTCSSTSCSRCRALGRPAPGQRRRALRTSCRAAAGGRMAPPRRR